MAENLTTLYLFKQYAGISASSTDDDALIVQLIDYASKAIASYCARTFEDTTYRTWLDGTGTSMLVLPEWPINRLYGVSFDIVDVLDVTFTGGQWADVTFDGTNLKLHSIDTAGDETDSSLAVATYKTIATLAAAVDALSGWSSTIKNGKDSEPSALIRPVNGEWALSTDEVTLSIPDETERARVSVAERQTIEMIRPSVFPAGVGNIFVYYKAGYTLPEEKGSNNAPTEAGTVPNDLEAICHNLIMQLYRTAKQKVGAYKSEHMGNYSYTLSDDAREVMAAGLRANSAVLTPYVNARAWG